MRARNQQHAARIIYILANMHGKLDPHRIQYAPTVFGLCSLRRGAEQHRGDVSTTGATLPSGGGSAAVVGQLLVELAVERVLVRLAAHPPVLIDLPEVLLVLTRLVRVRVGVGVRVRVRVGVRVGVRETKSKRQRRAPAPAPP